MIKILIAYQTTQYIYNEPTVMGCILNIIGECIEVSNLLQTNTYIFIIQGEYVIQRERKDALIINTFRLLPRRKI